MDFTFAIISLYYGFIALRTAYYAWRYRKLIFDNEFTTYDRAIVRNIAFFFLTPIAVYLHELGHAVAFKHYGAQNIQIAFRFYYGYTSSTTILPDVQQWWVALAGNLVTLALGLIAAAIAVSTKINRLWRSMALNFSAFQLTLVLLFYPLTCVTGLFEGDFNVIYNHEFMGPRWYTTLAIHLILLIGFLAVYLSDVGRHWWKTIFAVVGEDGYIDLNQAQSSS